MAEVYDNNSRKGKSLHPLKVAFICDDLMIGGWSSLVQTIANFNPDKVIPLVICLFGKGENAKYLEKRGIHVHCFGFKKYNLIWKLPVLSIFLRKEKVDIVHSQLFLSHLIGQTAAIMAGIPFKIMHVHTIESKHKGFAGLILKSIIKSIDMIISVSLAAEKTFKEIYPYFKGMSRVIYNGIDVSEFKARVKSSNYTKDKFGLNKGDFCAITVANLKWQKGHKYLVEAAGLLNDPSIHFLIVGDGPEKEALNDLIHRNKLEKQFIFLGKREDVPELLVLADILILPSVLEGFGICILEAFAGGVPVLATNIYGILEIAENGENAILVPPATPRELAEAIIRLKNDHGLRENLRTSAMEKIYEYDISKIAEQYQKVYWELIS